MTVRLPRLLVRLGVTPAVSLLARTWQVERLHASRYELVRRSAAPVVFLLWHETLLPLLWCHRRQGIGVVASENYDGRYVTDYARRLGYETIGGSSSRGGARAFRRVLRLLGEGRTVAITPDGPRGPRRVLKKGALVAAQRVGAQVMPVHAWSGEAWRLRSWDRFLVPRPFTEVRVAYGVPFAVTPGRQGLAEAMARAEGELSTLEGEVEWPDAAPPTA
jgi:lysophospholipid acyltransferase (LPLAT)-like uncharacterized protein